MQTLPLLRLQRAIYNKQNTAVFRPHGFSNIYHFLEGTSQMVRLILHPELFPPVHPAARSHSQINHVLISGQTSCDYTKWTCFLEYVYLDLFPQVKRPLLHIGRDDEFLKKGRLWCAPYIAVFRNWDSAGGGDFFPEPLGVDLVRAAAYRRVGISLPHRNEKDYLELLQIQRKNKRRILNEETLLSRIQGNFSDSVRFVEFQIMSRFRQEWSCWRKRRRRNR